ncbi:Cytochrome c oxidase assembly factor 3 homolog, mitochondrial [Anthophora plagiata]
MQPDHKAEFMQKLDLAKDKHKLKYSDLIYMKQAEEVAIQKALRYRSTRTKCNIAGIALTGITVGIYLYTIHAVKQETFLDDLNEPEKVIETSN